VTVTIRYYARLKEEAGRSQETVETQATTVDALWTEAASRHGFTLEAGLIKAAQADEFCAWSAPLVPGALVVFMPPVAGG
jgi:molybdopterin converting factor small subunit